MSMPTLGDFKKALKDNPGVPLFVWVNWEKGDGSYIEVSRTKFLRGIGADVPFEHDGRHDANVIDFRVDDDGIYVC